MSADTYSAINPLPVRFPATHPPVKGDHIDIGVWPNGWQFMTQRDRIRFEQLPEDERAQYRSAFEGQASALADR